MEKKLQEMENIHEKMNIDPLQDNYHDILEFAENYFNAHERSPEGTHPITYLLQQFVRLIVLTLISIFVSHRHDNSHVKEEK